MVRCRKSFIERRRRVQFDGMQAPRLPQHGCSYCRRFVLFQRCWSVGSLCVAFNSIGYSEARGEADSASERERGGLGGSLSLAPWKRARGSRDLCTHSHTHTHAADDSFSATEKKIYVYKCDDQNEGLFQMKLVSLKDPFRVHALYAGAHRV